MRFAYMLVALCLACFFTDSFASKKDYKNLIDQLRNAIQETRGRQNGGKSEPKPKEKLDAETEWQLGRMHIIDGANESIPSSYRPWEYVPPQHKNGTDEIFPLLEEPTTQQNESQHGKRKFVFEKGSPQLWTGGVVVYKWDTGHRQFTKPKSRATIEKAMRWYEANSCIKWVEWTPQTEAVVGHSDYVVIGGGQGCSAYLGRNGETEITLEEPWCVTFDTTLHEMGHTLGMHHEHVRNDRDEHLTMKWDLIPEARDGTNYGKTHTFNYAPYDLGSNMHYSLYDGSKVYNKMAMVPKDGELSFLATFHRPGVMSFYDLLGINKAYGCADKCTHKPRCENTGFVDFKCQCRCPSNLIGSTCGEVQTDSDCGGVLNVASSGSVTVQSPNYPSRYMSGKVCTWLVKGPVGSVLELTMNDFHIPHGGYRKNRVDKEVMICPHSLEIRYNLVAQPGPLYCGENWQRGPITTTQVADSNYMMLRFTSEKVGNIGRGFKATIKAKKPGCGSRSMCQNGATCVDTVVGFKCNCHLGFSGTFCEASAVATLVCRFDTFQNCPLVQDGNDELDWIIHQGQTESGDTGPKSGAGGEGSYLYVEASSPAQPGDRARLLSYEVSAIVRCIQFSYLMHGRDMGSLSLSVIEGGVKRQVWGVTGEQGEEWRVARATAGSGAGAYKVVIEAVIGDGYKSDIAIDDLYVFQHPCAGHERVTSPPAPTTSTTNAPIIVETSSTAPPVETTMYPVIDPIIAPTMSPVIDPIIAPITVRMVRNMPEWVNGVLGYDVMVASRDGPTSLLWQREVYNICTQNQPWRYECPYTVYTCSFDDHTICSNYFHQDKGDNFDWTITDGSSTTPNTGPLSDHSGYGQYLLAEASEPRFVGDKARIVSRKIVLNTPTCLQFWYHISGHTPSTLHLSLRIYYSTYGGDYMDYTLWSSDGSVSQDWRHEKIDLIAIPEFHVVLEAEVGGWQGDIGLDDVTLSAGKCRHHSTPFPFSW